MMADERLLTMPLARVHPLYVAKAERKGRTRAEVDTIIRWLTGFDDAQLEAHLAAGSDLATFFAEAPAPHPARDRITGKVCGVRVEDIEHPLIRDIRRLDKLIDELAKGGPMERILRTTEGA
jgi:hypothetical protein